MGRSTSATIVAFALILAACGGGEAAAPEPTPTDSPAPTATATAPDELALLQTEVGLDGDTYALVQPGETVEIDHLLYNRSTAARSMTFRIRDTDLDVSLALTSLRVGPEEAIHFTSTVAVPDTAKVGDVLDYTVLAAVSSDTDQRAVMTVKLEVTDAVGQRPEIGPHRGQTETNEKVTLYVLTGADDADGDLDFSSLRIVAGGFRAADLVARPDGTIVYLPFQNVTGTDLVLYELCDSEQRCDTNVITIDVAGP